MFMVQKEQSEVKLTEYERLLVSFKPRRIEDYDDPEYDRVKKQCEIYFERDFENDLSRDEETFFNLLCTLISEVDDRLK